MRLYDEFLLCKGDHFSIYFHAKDAGSSEVYDYFKNCDHVTRATLLYLVKRMSEAGKIYDPTKFILEDRENKIYAFKPKKERFFCFFFVERTIIITSAYKKKRQRLDKSELKKAIEIRKEYIC